MCANRAIANIQLQHMRYYMCNTRLLSYIIVTSKHTSCHFTQIFITLQVLIEVQSQYLYGLILQAVLSQVKQGLTFTLAALFCKNSVCLAIVQLFFQKTVPDISGKCLINFGENWRWKCGTSKTMAIDKSICHLMGL